MTQERWSAVDRYFNSVLSPSDAALDAAQAAAAGAGLPAMQVSQAQGRMLQLLARAIGARTALEVGTLAAYSTIWLARGLPADGRVITLEMDPKHAEVARANLAAAGLAGRVEVRLGRASDTLAALVAERAGPFDLIFVDADKASSPEYLRRSLELSRPGTLILLDNVVRGGTVIDPNSTSRDVQGIRDFMELAGADHRLTATAVQTVGSKGYDGFAMVLVGE
jgi:predicted O-methyltransferase YrrM